MTSICCDAYLIYDHHVGDEICEDCGRVTRFFEDANHTEQNRLLLNSVEFELKKICDNNNFVDSIFETALAELRKKRGKTTVERAAMSLHSACQVLNVPRTLKEIAGMFYLQPMTLGKKNQSLISLTRPSQLASRVLSNLNITSLPLAEKISSKADTLFFNVLVSVSPQTALAVSIALLSPDLKTSVVAEQCQISVQTLKKHLKKVTI